MAEHGFDDFGELRARSIADPEWFWDAFVRFVGIEWSTPFTQVLDTSAGIEWATWFTGGRLNVAHDCVDKWADRADWRDRPAVVWEGEEGATRTVAYAELRTLTDRIAHGLAARGVGLWDVVASATRAGSLDGAIRQAGHNPIERLRQEFPKLAAIAFNGGTAAKAGRKLLHEGRGVELIDLPSSSAAYTRPFVDKAATWRQLGRFCASGVSEA